MPFSESRGTPLLLILVVAGVVGSSYIEHRNLVEQEKRQYPTPAYLVDVTEDGDKLHLFADGEGSTGEPWWSEPDTAGVMLLRPRASYVLLPHAMAGFESAYWATLHPKEVEAIIGLDALVPGYVEQSEETPSVSRGVPEVPVHAFVSSRDEDPRWKETVTAYAEATGGQAVVLDEDRYIRLDYPGQQAIRGSSTHKRAHIPQGRRPRVWASGDWATLGHPCRSLVLGRTNRRPVDDLEARMSTPHR